MWRGSKRTKRPSVAFDMVREQVYVSNLSAPFTSRVAMHGIQDRGLEKPRAPSSSQWACEIYFGRLRIGSGKCREGFAALPPPVRKAYGFPSTPEKKLEATPRAA